jgi:DNA repair protein RadC
LREGNRRMIISEKNKMVCSSKDVSEVLVSLLNFEQDHDREKEHFWILGLNTKNVIQYADLVSLGSLSASIVHPRETFRLAVMKATAAIIVGHNHPSGDTKPSQEDILLTKRLCQAGEILGIKVLDHVIIGSEGNYFSFCDNGMIQKG